jgi:hypothetical protein
MTRTPVVRVSGRVAGFTHGVAIGLSVNGRFGGFTDFAKADGTFAWWNLDPGEYAIRAWQGIPSLAWATFSGTRPPDSALMTITVADANVDNIELRMRPPFDIAGQVEYEAGTSEPHAAQWWLRLAIEGLNGGGGDAALAADGQFILNPLVPGRYKVMCDCGRPVYVKSMWLGAVQIEGDILDLRDGPAGATLRVRVSSAFGAISGTVQGDRAAMTGLKVALVSPGPDRGPRFAAIDPGGRYSFDSIVPGEYQLAVVDDDDLLLQGAEGLEQYGPAIVTAKVLAGESIVRNPGIFKRQ